VRRRKGLSHISRPDRPDLVSRRAPARTLPAVRHPLRLAPESEHARAQIPKSGTPYFAFSNIHRVGVVSLAISETPSDGNRASAYYCPQSAANDTWYVRCETRLGEWRTSLDQAYGHREALRHWYSAGGDCPQFRAPRHWRTDRKRALSGQRISG
jgi:hypothetical protein